MIPVPDIDLEAFPIARPMPRHRMRMMHRRWTVCQILREIYCDSTDPLIKYKCRVAHTMTRAMIEEIMKHNPTWGRNRWPWREKLDLQAHQKQFDPEQLK